MEANERLSVEIFLKPSTLATVRRRQQIAEMLVEGVSYREICEELSCSTMTVADVSKSLKEAGVI